MHHLILSPRLNEVILNQVRKLKLNYRVDDLAPSTWKELNQQAVGQQVVWAGASDRTIFGDPKINWAFRALHDYFHLKLGLGFSVEKEIELGRIQASMFEGKLADIVFCEVAGQALYFGEAGKFVDDQVGFTQAWLADKRIVA